MKFKLVENLEEEYSTESFIEEEQDGTFLTKDDLFIDKLNKNLFDNL